MPPKTLLMRCRASCGRHGFSTVAMSLSAVAMLGSLGIAVDVGRLYVVKNESQVHVDSATLDSARELDGTAEGLSRARTAVAANLNRWNMGSQVFSGTQVEFATAKDGPWSVNPASATTMMFTRVTSNVSLPVVFMPVVNKSFSRVVRAQAVGGQVPKTYFREGGFPFSPFAHNNGPPDFGLVKGQRYTLRWAANPRENKNVCPGDNKMSMIVLAEAGGGSERGFIEESSSSNIREAIEGDYQTRPVYVNGTVLMTGGAKQTQLDSLLTRISQDSDKGAKTFADYNGNGRRLVVVPINTGHPEYRVLGFGAFLLLHSSEYNKGGNEPFCAEYVGAHVQGSKKGGAGAPGAYVVRLVQ